jgi:hypothetical protein
MTTVIHYRDRGALGTAQVMPIVRGTIYGNPHTYRHTCPICRTSHTRDASIAAFREYWYLPQNEGLRQRALRELRDKVLLCWCKPRDCHGDVIADYVNHFYETPVA